LDAPIPAPAQQLAIGGEERRADRDATLAEARPSLIQGNLEHLAIRHGPRSIGTAQVNQLSQCATSGSAASSFPLPLSMRSNSPTTLACYRPPGELFDLGSQCGGAAAEQNRPQFRVVSGD
jgi:hypothetical protein